MVKFLKQPMMRRVLYALVPIYLYSVWLYGPRLLASSLVVFALGASTEWLFERKKSKKLSEAVLVTCALFSLAFPPQTPLWILGVGIVFAVAMGKGVYGGFGRNIFNPAITGRAFVYISFAVALNGAYTSFGNFGIQAADAVASATPLALMRAAGHGAVAVGASAGIHSAPSLWDMLLGFKVGATGEGMILLVLAAAIYLIATKTASWKIVLGSVLAASALNAALYYGGVEKALPMESLLAGSFLFVTVFMATDPVSAPKRQLSHWIYGALIGATVVIIRTFSAFSEGTSFAILFGNTFAALIDRGVDALAKKPAAPAKGGAK